MKRLGIVLTAVAMGVVGVGLLRQGWADGPAVQDQPRLRRPIALVLSEDGKRLFVANQRSGSVSVIDVAAAKVEAETVVGRKLSDLCAGPADSLLAVDEEAHELLVLGRNGAALETTHRVKVAPFPVSVRVAGERCFVASLWARRLTVFHLGPKGPPKAVKVVELPFAPRLTLPMPGRNQVVVADGFGGQLALVNADKGEVESVRPLPAHNIRGLALTPDGKEVLLVHQVLNDKAQTTVTDVHWGNLLANQMRTVRVTDLLDPKADLIPGGQRYPLGSFGRGGGDPSGLAVSADGRVVVSLGGVDEVALAEAVAADWRRVPVGRRPSAIAIGPDGKRRFVANTFGDSVSVIDMAAKEFAREIKLGPLPELSAADRGELLFHDARMSHDGWLSCQSCHTDGHTNGLLADTLGDGDFGAPKRVLTLRGVKDTGPWGWSGGVEKLSDQVRKSIETTMRGPKPSADEVRDLTAFLESLPPPPRLDQDETATARGKAVFLNQGCSNCHAAPVFTSAKGYDVGLEDEFGRTSFNPPSLRGVGLGGPFFHDGRATTLEEVVGKHRHQIEERLSEADRMDLLTFLRGL